MRTKYCELVQKVNTLKRDFRAIMNLYELEINELQSYVYELRRQHDEATEANSLNFKKESD